jgi:hypothetical protein
LDDLQNAINEKLGLIRNKVSYHLLEPYEFEALSQTSTSNCEKNGISGINSMYRYISKINYSKQLWKCPRDIHVHKAPDMCGKKCNRIDRCCSHDGWVYEEKSKYLVAEEYA